MQSRKLALAVFLILLAALLAVGNVWTTAARSLIPLQITERIVKKEIRREKHRGKDDVHLLHTQSGRILHVDRHIYDAVREGDELKKDAWSARLYHGGALTTLKWSADFLGMLRVMPLILCLMVIVAMVTCSVRAAEDRLYLHPSETEGC